MYIYIVVVVGPVEMWKSHFIVDSKGIVFHRGCGNRCGKPSAPVEKFSILKVFHISTGTIIAMPVEMWKTRS
jgi:hypothetical protein